MVSKKWLSIVIGMALYLSACSGLPLPTTNVPQNQTPTTIAQTPTSNSITPYPSNATIESTNTTQPEKTPQETQNVTPQTTEQIIEQTEATEQPSPPPNTATPTSTPTQIAYPYHLQMGSPVYLENFAHPDIGCNWFGIAGQVFNEDGSIAINILVEVGGEINGEPINGMSITGIAPLYGPGGYELVLGDQPEETHHSIWLQLHDTEGETLSAKTYINTFNECSKNLILINFTNKELVQIFFPMITK